MRREIVGQPNQGIELPINGSPVWIELGAGRIRPRMVALGPLDKGTYTDEARQTMLGAHLLAMDHTPATSNTLVVREVDNGNNDIAVVAEYNAIEGDVMDTLRTMVHSQNTIILGEVVVPVDHMLIGRPGERITKVYSHPQALGQCSPYLLEYYPDAQRISSSSTAQAVIDILEIPNAAAIASRLAASKNGLPILDEHIGENRQNATRFWLIGRGETYPTGNDITAIFLTPLEDRPGILWEHLGVLKDHGINLNDIKSHPTGKMEGKHAFVIKLDGHIKEKAVAEAVVILEQQYCESLKVLGSWKKAEIPEGVSEPGTINCE